MNNNENTMTILSVHYTPSFYFKKTKTTHYFGTSNQTPKWLTKCRHALQTSAAGECQGPLPKLTCWLASLCPRFAHSPRTALGLAYYQSWQTCLKVAGNIGTRFGNNNNITRHNLGNTGEVCYSCTCDSLLQEYPNYGARYLGAHRNNLI